jgi:phytoene desaturase
VRHRHQDVELNLERGSAFGLSHDFFQVGPFRPANQDPRVRNLFFVGASTQPGTGLPMVMLSARLVTERILRHAGVRPRAVAAAAPPRIAGSAA